MSESADERDAAPAQDGLVVELAKDDVARKRFLKMAGKSMGSAAAAASLGAFIAACGSSSSSSTGTSTGTGSGSGDLKIVNYALTLEYLEATFYAEVVKAGLFSGAVGATVKQFAQEEAQHVTALHAAASSLGTPAAKPKTKFPLDKGAAYIAKLAATVENLGAAAYLGQAGNIKDPKILASALAIHSVEARHAATLNVVLKLDPTPDGAFGKPMSMEQVLPIASQFIVK